MTPLMVSWADLNCIKASEMDTSYLWICEWIYLVKEGRAMIQKRKDEIWLWEKPETGQNKRIKSSQTKVEQVIKNKPWLSSNHLVLQVKLYVLHFIFKVTDRLLGITKRRWLGGRKRKQRSHSLDLVETSIWIPSYLAELKLTASALEMSCLGETIKGF